VFPPIMLATWKPDFRNGRSTKAERFMRTRARGSPSWPELMLTGRIHYSRLIETNSQNLLADRGRAIHFGKDRCCVAWNAPDSGSPEPALRLGGAGARRVHPITSNNIIQAAKRMSHASTNSLPAARTRPSICAIVTRRASGLSPARNALHGGGRRV
jgi:hypothetical protein